MNRHDSRDVRSYRLVNGRIVQSVGMPDDDYTEDAKEYALYPPPPRYCPECGHMGCDPRCPAWRDPEEDEQENGE